MEFRSLEELREADEATLSFSPFGLGGKLRSEDAAKFQQEVVSHPDLAPGVPPRVRDTFERLRITHAYGVLNYQLFTVAYDQAHLALEFVLRERFIEFHGDTAQFRGADGPHDIPTTPLPLSFRSCVPLWEIRLRDLDGVGDFLGMPGPAFGRGSS